jgi:fucose permease
MARHIRPAVPVSYLAFIFVGINAAVGGVLVLAQMNDYGVDRAVIGITFITGSAGFVLGSLHSGPLIHRLGMRIALLTGCATFILAALYLATRPPLVALLAVQLVTGYAAGILESILSAYIAAQPDATTLLNRLHAFFGVGALAGPVLATWIVGRTAWTVVYLVLAVACVPLAVGFALACPRQLGAAGAATPAPAAPREPDAPAVRQGGLLGIALRDRGVLVGAVMLAVYVGVELSVGNWAFSYLVQGRGLAQSLAGYAVSGYWLGLTAGRFLISPVATRLGATTSGLMYACLSGIAAATTLLCLAPLGLAPSGIAAGATLALLGFFLGPVFPTTMAITPRITQARLAATAIGVMNAGSAVGGAALPWLAGAITQGAGIGMLFPFVLGLAALQFATWVPIARRIRTGQPADGTDMGAGVTGPGLG